MWKTLVKVPIVLGGDWPLPSKSSSPWNQNLPYFEIVRPITHHPLKLGPPNLDQMFKIPWLRSLLLWGLNELHMSNLTYFQNPVYLHPLRLWNICETCKNGCKRSLSHILHGCARKCSPTRTCHGLWNSRIASLVRPLLASQSSTRRLAMYFWMLLHAFTKIYIPHMP